MSAILTFPIFETRAATFAKRNLLDRVLSIVDAGVASFARLLDRLAAAIIHRDEKKRAAIMEDMAGEIAGVLIVSDFWGRHQVAKKAAAAGVEPAAPVYLGGGPPSGPPPDEPEGDDYDGPIDIRVEVLTGLNDELPKIPNAEAIADIVSRTPMLAQPVETGGPKWLQIARAYQEQHAFGLAKSADLELTKRVQAHIARVLEEGGTVESATARIAEMGDFDRAYAETVFRTNAASAFSAGVIRQVREPETNYHFPALAYEAVHDASTRENHLAADGLIAAVHDPVWNVWTPPAGYN